MKKLASYEYVDYVPAAPLRKLAFSGFRNGSLAGFILRPSTSTDTKTVLDSVFSCSASAAAFARRWAGNIDPGSPQSAGRRSIGRNWQNFGGYRRPHRRWPRKPHGSASPAQRGAVDNASLAELPFWKWNGCPGQNAWKGGSPVEIPAH